MRLFLIAAFALGLSAQTTKTNVAGVVYDGNGNLVTVGSVIITPSRQFTAFAGELVQPKAVYAPILAGSFSVALYPNDTGVPASTYYKVSYLVPGSGQVNQSWVVPTTGLTISPPIVGVPPLPGYAFSPNQLLQLGAVNGMALVYNGSSWVPNVIGKCKAQDVGITSSTFTHNYGSTNVEAYFKDAANKYIEPKDWTITNANTVSYTFDAATTVTVCVK